MRLSSLFCDNMVLQQGRPIPVWGWSQPGEKIVVTLNGQSREAVTGKDGRWMVRLPSMRAGGPHEMQVSGPQTIALHNILVGEVWIASGQSNMEWSVGVSANAKPEIAKANHPALRLFTVAKNAVVDRQMDVAGRWEVCSPKTIEAFSAVAYYFGRELHRKLRVPVGLINTSWGGTLAEAWTSREALVANPLFKPLVLEYEKNLPRFAQARADYEAKVKEGEEKYYPADPGNTGFPRGWADPATRTDGWGTMHLPRMWQSEGLNFSGVVWFRKEVEVPAAWAGQELTLNLAPCDKHDTTYFNNVEVGGIGRANPNAWSIPREYTIPGHLVKPGRNVIAVRIYSYVFAGGMIGSPAQMKLARAAQPDAQTIPLDGPWQYQVEHNFGVIAPINALLPPGPGNPNSLYSLYRGMIEPLIPYAIRGAIWYQGESNAGRAYEYRTLFPLMIRSWWKPWRQGPFPFLFVQLANYQARHPVPCESQWAELREAQTMTLRLPNTGMAVTIDIGEENDIHPKNKQDVGRRLAAPALNQVYRCKSIVPSGPLYRSAKRVGNQIRVSFAHVGKGLVAKGGKLTGFAVAGADRKFVWAEAKIDPATGSAQARNAVVVSSPAVPKPVAVRYAWADNPVCNLYNRDGLPASPFRTDQWPGLTAPQKKK